MKTSLKKGLSYGTTSGVITTLGLLIGLFASTNSKSVVIAGILTIAFADSFSDGLGIHISEESENHHSKKEIWEATIATIISKMILGFSFVIPVILFPLELAIITDVFWGVLALSALSYKIALQNNEKPASVLLEHIGIAFLVIVGSYFIGEYINSVFK